ncbi:uncharacterized protein [Diabrotica undecimpunctata]|uniref:uncharacterized protein n=1 Tax=Diabrotica undecimpunctata TaxID=50387 RepID=UPI003B639FFE
MKNFGKRMVAKKSATKRDAPLLFVNNYKFNFSEKLKSGESRWRCRTKGCNAAVYTIGDDIVISRQNLNHSHDSLEANCIQQQFVRVAAKRKAAEDISTQPRKILHLVLSEEENTNLTIMNLKSVKRSIYNVRRKLLPVLPKTLEEVLESLEKLEDPIITSRNENILLVNDKSAKLTIISCETNLGHLCKCSRIYMDGTFKYCPKFYYQMFTIHGYYNGHYIPLVFCLWPDKLSSTYETCFNLIRTKCLELTLNFLPKDIVIDFEKSIHEAVKSVWGQSKIIGCRFHLSQAWWGKIQELGLTNDHKNRTEMRKLIGYCFGLLFLDHQEVGDCLVFDLIEIMPESVELNAFINYLVGTYLC